MPDFETKDSGDRQEFDSGMVRDTAEGKSRWDLLFVPGVPYSEQPLNRVASLMARGAEKYGDHNWTLANSPEELARFRSSAARHFAQWMSGDTDEDHAAATWFNIQAALVLEWKLSPGPGAVPQEKEAPAVPPLDSWWWHTRAQAQYAMLGYVDGQDPSDYPHEVLNQNPFSAEFRNDDEGS